MRFRSSPRQIKKASEDLATLPYDHPGRKKARDLIDLEYKESFEAENNFRSRWRLDRYLHSLDEAKELVNHLCKIIPKCPPIKDVAECNKPGFSGLYDPAKQIILVPHHQPEVVIIAHEVAHHFIVNSNHIGVWPLIKCIFSPFHKEHGELFMQELNRILNWLLALQDKHNKTLDTMGSLWLVSNLSVVHLLREDSK